MSEELKPCPFCGYKLTMQEGVCPGEDCVDDETGQWHFTGICCPSCAVFLPKAEENSSVYDGMKAWNARHDAAKDDEIDLLRGAIEWCLARDERNGSLPQAYTDKLAAALKGDAQ